MSAPARQKFSLRRPQTAKERNLVKFALNSTVRGMISPALKRPLTRDNVYISNGKYVHYVLAQPKNFEPRSFKMNPEDERGIRTVVASPKGTWDDVLGKPKNPQKLQSILVPKDKLTKMSRSFTENPILMTVTNPGYKKNPVDVEYEPGSKQYRVYRTNPTKQYGPSKAVTFKPTGVRISGPKGNYVRYQKISPKRFDVRSFRTISLGRRGTKAVIGCPKGKYDPRTKTCRVGTRVQAVLVPKSRHRSSKAKGLRMARNPGVPLWDNPEFGSLPVGPTEFARNPMDIATSMMPIYNDNPRRGYDPDDEPPDPYDEEDDRSEFADPGGGSALRAESPTNPRNLPCPKCGAENVLTPEDRMRGYQCNRCADRAEGRYMENPCGSKSYCDNPSHRHNAFPIETAGLYDDNIPAHHFAYNAPIPGYYGAAFNENPRLSVGDFVRNVKRVMKGNELELEKKSLGRISSIGQFMGDTVYTVSFMEDGKTKTFKFFAHELAPETGPLSRFDDNKFRYRPASPRRLQRYRHADNRYPKYGEVSALAKQPASRPGVGSPHKSVRRVKIPIAKFEAWLASSGSPDEKHRYAKARAAYRRFHKGADPEYVTRRMVDVGAGKKIVARSFAYSMGKSPFEPYITPKGSGKGPHKAYLHEYETMPEGVTVPGGKVVIKPLDGQTKITDWIHR